VSDISFEEFQLLCASDDQLSAVLRLDERSEKGGTGEIHQAIRDHALDLDSVAAIARLSIFLFINSSGTKTVFDTNATAEYVKALITGLVEGWHLRPCFRTSYSEWFALAEGFVQHIDEAFGPLKIAKRGKFQRAFLLGVQAGFGKWASTSVMGLERACARFGPDDVDVIMSSVPNLNAGRLDAFTYTEPTSAASSEESRRAA